MEYSFELKIPKSRVAVLIGIDGKIKRKIEVETKTELNIDSKEGDIFIKSEDALSIYTTKEIVQAIGRGFNPNIALLLLKPDYVFENFDITEFAKTKNHMIRIKGRIIGANGRARKIIEELTECYVSVFGKTVCVIGEAENVPIARRAIEALLSGSPHSSVYNWLEKQRREIKRRKILGDV